MTDAFTAHIINYVRHSMSDDAILALVKSQLGVKHLGAPLAPVAKARPGRKPGKKPGRKPGPKPAAKPAAAPAAKPVAAPAHAPVKRGPGRPKGSGKVGRPKGKVGRPSGGLADTLNHVERIVKASSGVAASDVAKAASIPQSRAATALKALKLAKRIYQGGDRRFARYAGDAKTAEQASLNARKNASGPQGRGGKKK